MFVTEVHGCQCPCCSEPIGMGVKEEATVWKIYAVCLNTSDCCTSRRVGTVLRQDIKHTDEVGEKGEPLVRRYAR